MKNLALNLPIQEMIATQKKSNGGRELLLCFENVNAK